MSEVYIRSQNREKLYCFGDSFSELQYCETKGYETGKKGEAHHTICICDGSLERIAEYDSKERCLEVLDEIQNVCGLNILIPGYYTWIAGAEGALKEPVIGAPRVYEMPEK